MQLPHAIVAAGALIGVGFAAAGYLRSDAYSYPEGRYEIVHLDRVFTARLNTKTGQSSLCGVYGLDGPADKQRPACGPLDELASLKPGQ